MNILFTLLCLLSFSTVAAAQSNSSASSELAGGDSAGESTSAETNPASEPPSAEKSHSEAMNLCISGSCYPSVWGSRAGRVACGTDVSSDACIEPSSTNRSSSRDSSQTYK